MERVYAQAGAIAYRRRGESIKVLLISTSSGKHLTIPKGLIDPGFTATETVLNEAFEEAGIEGEVLSPPIGSYRIDKWGGRCDVDVFVMTVTRELDDWPEAFMRRRLWTDYRQAARRVKHGDLGKLILKLPDRLILAGLAT